jgi:hypothetical protein
MTPTGVLPVYAVVLIVVAVVLSCLFCALFSSFKIVVRSRHGAVRVLSNLKYLPEIIVVKEEYVEVKKKLSKRQLRRKKMRELAQELKLTEAEKARWAEHERRIEDVEDEPIVAGPLSPSKKLLSWVVGAFNSKSGKVLPASAVGTMDLEAGDGRLGFSSKSGVSMDSGEDMPDGSSKSKRFISQDRLQRKEARMLLMKPTVVEEEPVAEVGEEVVFDSTVSLLSLAMAKRKRVAEIMMGRKQRKDPARNAVDVVALNAGPPLGMVPQGYELVSQELGPALLTPEVLIYKRILYLWDGSVGNISGWYVGTIVGTSEQAGFNYRIKYDRAETKSIFVDGIQPVFLALEGENAFGRRWVVMQKKGPPQLENDNLRYT